MRLAPGVDGRLHKSGDGDPGNFDRILETEENPRPGTLLRSQGQQVLPPVEDAALRDFIIRTAGKDGAEGALSGTIGTHDGVHLPGRNGQVNPP